jgi:hypothetical protein
MKYGTMLRMETKKKLEILLEFRPRLYTQMISDHSVSTVLVIFYKDMEMAAEANRQTRPNTDCK